MLVARSTLEDNVSDIPPMPQLHYRWCSSLTFVHGCCQPFIIEAISGQRRHRNPMLQSRLPQLHRFEQARHHASHSALKGGCRGNSEITTVK